MKPTFKLLLLAAGLVGLSACSSSSGPSDPYYHAWYNVYGSYCGTGHPTAGCNFYSDGTKITASGDPYYNGGNTVYYDLWTYSDSYGNASSYLGYAWLSSSGILYDQFGNALNEQNSDDTASVMDVVAQAAEKEKMVSKEVGKALAQKYALAEDKGIAISKTLQDWAKLGKDRARTEADVSDFAKRIYGVDPVKAKTALLKAVATKDQSPVEEMNIDVAAYWGTSPEVSKQILKNWYKEEVAAYGVN